jgi:hypothetical protein
VCSAGEFHDRRGQIDICDKLRSYLPDRDVRAAHHHRNTNVLIERRHLAGKHPVLALVIAVIRGQHDVGAVQPADGLK